MADGFLEPEVPSNACLMRSEVVVTERSAQELLDTLS